MSKLPVLSAKDVIRILNTFGFKVHRQTGSHIHLWNEDTRLLVTVPNHKELAKGCSWAGGALFSRVRWEIYKKK